MAAATPNKTNIDMIVKMTLFLVLMPFIVVIGEVKKLFRQLGCYSMV
jgi:hypothetical protein